MSTDEFSAPAALVNRDRYGRPLITPPGGGTPVPYTRVSTFASALDDGQGLVNWKAQHVALGIARRPDLAAIAAGLQYRDPGLAEVVERAADAALLNVKADHGTAIHTFTEPGNDTWTPDRMRPDVDAYLNRLTAERMSVEATELFVVNDDLQVAGTLDHIYVHPTYGRVVGDKKTGSLHPLGFAIQLACYAGGSVYDPATFERTPIDVSQDVAILAHIPKGAGRTDLYTVDIVKGRLAASIAQAVREWRAAAKDTTETGLSHLIPEPLPVTDPVLAAIRDATTVDGVRAVWNANQGTWTIDHTCAASDRIAAIEADRG